MIDNTEQKLVLRNYIIDGEVITVECDSEAFYEPLKKAQKMRIKLEGER